MSCSSQGRLKAADVRRSAAKSLSQIRDRGGFKMNRWYVPVCWMMSLMFLGGCVDRRDVVPGESLDIKKSFSFYFGIEADRVINVPQPQLVASAIEHDADWKLPHGIAVEKADIKVSPTLVGWSIGNTKYSAPGFEIAISGVVRVAKDAQPGQCEIFLNLPKLADVSSVLKAKTVFPNAPGSFSAPNTLKLESFEIHDSEFAKTISKGTKWILGGAVVLAILIGGALVKYLLSGEAAADRCPVCKAWNNYTEVLTDQKTDSGTFLTGSSTTEGFVRTCKACNSSWQVSKTTEYG